MINLKNDYSEGALPEIMEELLRTNLEKTVGYGEDEYTKMAIDNIKKAIKVDDCYIRLLVGGTQTNLTTIAHTLRAYEGVIAANTGHISTHEAGAIEATGHKVIEILTDESGKINVEQIKEQCEIHSNYHYVKPKMVYISNPTELGTLYKKDELMAIYNYCQENGLYLYIDGARMASALASDENDIRLEDYPKYCDIFYIGGTKCGLLFGEAIVFLNKELAIGYDNSAKQRGGILAKGRLLGIQFKTLFEENRYYKVGEHSNKMAILLKNGVTELGIPLKANSYTNQQFFIFTNEMIEKLSKKYKFEIWEKEDSERKSVRFVTSWATSEDDVMEFLTDLKELV